LYGPGVFTGGGGETPNSPVCLPNFKFLFLLACPFGRMGTRIARRWSTIFQSGYFIKRWGQGSGPYWQTKKEEQGAGDTDQVVPQVNECKNGGARSDKINIQHTNGDIGDLGVHRAVPGGGGTYILKGLWEVIGRGPECTKAVFWGGVGRGGESGGFIGGGLFYKPPT